MLIAALLGFTIAACLWWLYFKRSAPAAGEALGRIDSDQRGRVASNAYTLTHLLLIVGVIYMALGIEQVLVNLSRAPAGHSFQAPLNWPATVALYGGGAVYLGGRLLFVRLAMRRTPWSQIIAGLVVLLLMPASRLLPALAALALLCAFVVALVSYEWWTQSDRHPSNERPVTE